MALLSSLLVLAILLAIILVVLLSVPFLKQNKKPVRASKVREDLQKIKEQVEDSSD